MILFFAMLGCSVKGTIDLVKAERAYDLAQENKLSEVDVFSWTMADAYMKKSREEYANSNFEQAAILARKSQEWLEKIKPKSTQESSLETENNTTSKEEEE